jgi:hypothetical protein
MAFSVRLWGKGRRVSCDAPFDGRVSTADMDGYKSGIPPELEGGRHKAFGNAGRGVICFSWGELFRGWIENRLNLEEGS